MKLVFQFYYQTIGSNCSVVSKFFNSNNLSIKPGVYFFVVLCQFHRHVIVARQYFFGVKLFRVFSMLRFRSLSGTVLTVYRSEANSFGRECNVSRVMRNK